MDSWKEDLLTHGVGFPDLRLSLSRCTIHQNLSLTFLPNGPAKSWDPYAYGKPTRRGASLWSFISRFGRMAEKMNAEAFRLLWEERKEERGRERENEEGRRRGREFIGMGPGPTRTSSAKRHVHPARGPWRVPNLPTKVFLMRFDSWC